MPPRTATTNEGEVEEFRGLKEMVIFLFPKKENKGHVGRMQAPRCQLVSLRESGWHAIPTLPIQSLFF